LSSGYSQIFSYLEHNRICVLGLVSKERHNERATSRKSDKSKTVSKE